MNKTFKVVGLAYLSIGVVAYFQAKKEQESLIANNATTDTHGTPFIGLTTSELIGRALIWPYYSLGFEKPLPRSPGSIYGDTSGKF